MSFVRKRMRILVVQSVRDSEKPWWFAYLPRLPEGYEVQLAYEPKLVSDGRRTYWELLKLYARLEQYDVVVTLQDGPATFLFSLLNRFRLRRPYKHVVHEFITRERERMPKVRSVLKYGFLRFSLRSVDKIICSAREEIDYYESVFGFASETFAYVPLSCDPNLLRNETKKKGAYIISAGRTGRDYATFLESVRDLPVEVKVVAGKGALDSLSIPANVKAYFDIPRDDFIDMLASSMFVVVALEDRDISVGQRVVLEAMALGKGVIATDIGATRDYIDDGVNGLMVPPQDIAALRGAIENMLSSDEFVMTLGISARNKVKNCFLPQLTIPRICEAIRSISRV